MSDVSPDDLTAQHVKGYGSTSDEVYDRNAICLSDGHMWPCDTAVALGRIDALSADVARLEAERDGEAQGRAYWLDMAKRGVELLDAAESERDEALALVAEHAATIERLRDALGRVRDEAHGHPWTLDGRRPLPPEQCAICALVRSVLADTAPTPETHNG